MSFPEFDEAYYRSLIAAAGEAIIVADERGRAIDCNEAALQLLRCTREQLLESSPVEWSPEFQPNGQSSAVLTADIFGRVFAGSTERFTWVNRRADGTLVHVGVTARLNCIAGHRLVVIVSRDICEIVAMEAQVRSSEEMLRTILDGVDAYIYLKDREGRYLFANRLVRELWQVEMNEIIGYGDERFFDADTAANLRRNDRRVLEDGEVLRSEETNTVIETGATATFQSMKLPLRRADGTIYALCGVSVDITERKRTEMALQASEERLRQTLENAPNVAVQWYDRDGRVIYWNPASERLYRWSSAEALGRTLDELIHSPEEAAAFLETLTRLAEEGGCVGPAEFAVRDREGRERFVEATMFAIPGQAPDDRIFVCMDVDISARKRSEAEREEALALLNAAIEQSPSGIIIADAPDVRIRMANPAALGMRGESRHPLTGIEVSLHTQRWQTLRPDGSPYPPDELPLSRAVLRGETTHGEELIVCDEAGDDHWIQVNAAPVMRNGAVVAGIALFHEVTEQKRAAAGLRLFARIYESSGEAIAVLDADDRILMVNPRFVELTGYAEHEITGANLRNFSEDLVPPVLFERIRVALADIGYWQGEMLQRRRDGSVYPAWAVISVIRDADSGEISHQIASYTDVSERKEAEQRIENLAHHDTLTGLFNRYSLDSRLEQVLLSAQRDDERVAVMFVDLDRFKLINDTLGHRIGDLLLIEVAHRLRRCVRESDIVARLGGDEFIVALVGLATATDAAAVASKILAALSEGYFVGGHALYSSASLGIGVFPEDGRDAETLMRNADTAMYHAKERGRNNLQFFTAAMNQAAAERLAIERDLREALGNSEFELHYQPQIRVADGEDSGVEALIRWRHPERGLVSPTSFIPAAEECGLIGSIGDWVLREACRQLAEWRQQGLRGVHVSINVSAHQLRSPEFVDSVVAALAANKLGEGDIELEVTESVAMADPQLAIRQLSALRAKGVRIAIDDFGTGYSSLAYLKLLPIKVLKLDRTFVRDIETDANDAAISAATLALAHSLGLSVVAEGVENEAQRTFLTRHGCDYLQGFLLGRPQMPVELLARWRERLVSG